MVRLLGALALTVLTSAIANADVDYYCAVKNSQNQVVGSATVYSIFLKDQPTANKILLSLNDGTHLKSLSTISNDSYYDKNGKQVETTLDYGKFSLNNPAVHTHYNISLSILKGERIGTISIDENGSTKILDCDSTSQSE
jgi:hypothetical protein